MDNLSRGDITRKIEALEMKIEVEKLRLGLIDNEDELDRSEIQAQISDLNLEIERIMSRVNESTQSLKYMFIVNQINKMIK